MLSRDGQMPFEWQKCSCPGMLQADASQSRQTGINRAFTQFEETRQYFVWPSCQPLVTVQRDNHLLVLSTRIQWFVTAQTLQIGHQAELHFFFSNHQKSAPSSWLSFKNTCIWIPLTINQHQTHKDWARHQVDRKLVVPYCLQW